MHLRLFSSVLSLVCLCLPSSILTLETPMRVVESVKSALFYQACFGKQHVDNKFNKAYTDDVRKCHTQPPVLTMDQLYLDVAQTGIAIPGDAKYTADDVAKFKIRQDAQRLSMLTHMSNLTCVMRALNFWTADDKVNIDFYTQEGVAEEGKDKEIGITMIKEYQTCFKHAQSTPHDDNPEDKWKNLFGERVAFHNCERRVKDDICAKVIMSKWDDEKYGPFSIEYAELFGLPKDKFEASLVRYTERESGISMEERYIHDFVNSGEIPH